MKKLFALVLALCLVLGLCACATGNGNDTTESTEDTKNTTASVETTEATEATEATKAEPTYTVKVVDESGNPIAGAIVQLCLDACVPSVTNADGVAEFFLEKADYKVSFTVMPAGYDYTTEEHEFYFDNGSNEMTITLKAAE